MLLETQGCFSERDSPVDDSVSVEEALFPSHALSGGGGVGLINHDLH